MCTALREAEGRGSLWSSWTQPGTHACSLLDKSLLSCTIEAYEREREEHPALELVVPSCKLQITELLLENRDIRSTTRRACAHVIDEISSYRLRYFSSSDYVSSSFPTDLEHACI
jgi:hypothetical protein